jgi:hypothetical protein
MFTIDLLKGKAVPIKSRPEGIFFIAITLVVPIIAAIVMFAYSVHNKVIMSIQEQKMLSYQAKTKELGFAVDLQKSFDAEKDRINSYMEEVSKATIRHNQWSPSLVAIVQNLPADIILTELAVKQKSIRIKVPQKDDPTKTIDATVPVNNLQISLSGNAEDDPEEQIKTYRDAIRSSPTMQNKLDNTHVSQGSDTINGKDAVSFQIDCIFKPQI